MWRRNINKKKTKKQGLNEYVEMEHRSSESKASENEREYLGEEARKSEMRFRGLVETANIIPWEADPATWRFTYVGLQAAKILGYQIEEWYGDDFWVNHIYPEDRKWVVRFCQEASARCEDYEFEYRMLSNDGRIVWLHDKVSVVSSNGSPKVLRGFMFDITERKLLEEELRKHRDQLEDMVEARTSELIKINESLKREIAVRKRADEALRNSEEKYRSLYDENPSMYFTVNTDGAIISVNHFGAEQLGYSVEELVGQPVLNIFYEEDRKAVQDRLNEYLLNPTEFADWEFRKVRKDGSLLWVREFVRTMRQKDGNTVFLIVCEDITDRKQSEEIIKKNIEQLSKKSRYEAIISTITQSVHQSIHLQDVLEKAVEAMSQNIQGVDNIAFYMVEGKDAVLKAHRGYRDWFIKRVSRIPYPKGFTWWTIKTGNPRYVEDVDKDTIIGTAGRKLGTKSYASMPIRFEGKTVGVIDINSLKKNAFDKDELKLLEVVASQISVAIKNAQQAEALKQSKEAIKKNLNQLSKKSRYETIISAVTQSVHQSINLQDVFENSVEAMSKNIEKAENISIHIVEGDDAVIKAYRGHPKWAIEKLKKIPYPKGFTWKTIIDGKPRYCKDVENDTAIGPTGRKMGIKSYVSMPIRFIGKTVGCIGIASYEKKLLIKMN
ncbi:PAS domain S-box protein [Desulfobacterota bacterium AH_259_B03_O07]|nr:PAS domain S-box protein [Desulfobacterota bacterium AH_259_B03_O07]